MANCADRDECVLFQNAHSGDASMVDDCGACQHLSQSGPLVCDQPTFPYQLLTGCPRLENDHLAILAWLAIFRKPMHLKVWRSAQPSANHFHACTKKPLTHLECRERMKLTSGNSHNKGIQFPCYGVL
jgi:hypothetical protein